MSRVLPALSSATALLLTGCMVGPKYVKPTVPLAPTYKEADTASTQNSGWQKALPADAAQKGEWWVIFNDQELNALEALVAQQNQDLKAAEALLPAGPTYLGLAPGAGNPAPRWPLAN